MEFAGCRAYFCPDVIAGDGEQAAASKELLQRWEALGGSKVDEPNDATLHFSDDNNNETARSLMEPKSIRAKTTLIYKTQLIADALAAKQAGGELSDLDIYLLPPALWEQYQAERKPRPPAEGDESDEAARRGRRAAGSGGGVADQDDGRDGFDSPTTAPLDVLWTDFVDVNGANGYQISKRTAPAPPSSASAKKKRKTRKGSASEAPADADADGGAAQAADEVFEVERILKKRVRKGKQPEYLVQWMGYPDAADTTWEAKENLANAKALVDAFEKGGSPRSAKKTKSPETRRRSTRQSAGAANEGAAATSAAAAAAAAVVAATAADGSESDEFNLSQDTDYSQSQSQSESDSRTSRSRAKRGIDNRSSRRLKSLTHELSGDGTTAGKVIGGAASTGDPQVAAKRWSRTQDSKLLAVVSGKRRVSAALWTEASAETGRSVEDCKKRREWLQQRESQA